MEKQYLTLGEAEEIVMAAQIGMYNLDYPGNRSRLAHARLLVRMDTQRLGDEDMVNDISSTPDNNV